MISHPFPKCRAADRKRVRQHHVGAELFDLSGQHLFHPDRLIADEPGQNPAAQHESRSARGRNFRPCSRAQAVCSRTIVDRDLDGRVPQIDEIPGVEIGDAEQAGVADGQLPLVGRVLEPWMAGIKLRREIRNNPC